MNIEEMKDEVVSALTGRPLYGEVDSVKVKFSSKPEGGYEVEVKGYSPEYDHSVKEDMELHIYRQVNEDSIDDLVEWHVLKNESDLQRAVELDEVIGFSMG